MEWPKLKNIILILLLCVNVFLLILAGFQESRSARYEEETRQAALEALARNGISFGPERLPEDAALQPLTVTRDRESEAAVAQALLGEASPQGAGEVRQQYAGEGGTAEFSMNGDITVEFRPGAWQKEPDRSWEDASQACLERIGFQGLPVSSDPEAEDDGLVRLTYCQVWEGAPVFSCQLTLVWQGDNLLRLEGTRLAGTSASSGTGAAPLSTAAVLVRFLAGINEGGYVCGRIDEMTAGYLLDGATRPVELTPVWRLDTDSGVFYLDAFTGVLTPEQT